MNFKSIIVGGFLALGVLSAPALAAPAPAKGVQVAQVTERTVVRTTPAGRRVVVKRTVVRHDRGLHRGWRHAPAYGARRTVIMKKRGPLGASRTTIVRRGPHGATRTVIRKRGPLGRTKTTIIQN